MWTEMDRFGFLDPWRVLDRMNRAASGLLASPAGAFPLVNVWMDGDTAVATSELPGVDAKDVDISVAGKTVILRGSRAVEEACEGDCRHRQERWSGSFSRSIELPYLIDQNKVEARFTKGVLQLTLPRAEADKPKKITITSE